ncbi:hypothetical protein F5887DRAFT_1103439, partial [Amanita rubescens]
MYEAKNDLLNILKERYKCSHFRILVIGRANAGKTTILEKVCGVAKGTKPMVYSWYDHDLKRPSNIHLAPTIERGIHNIEAQISYQGSNFIFHDSQGFEAGDKKELEDVWAFIEKRRTDSTRTREQLHMIWYCIPMGGSRPIQSEELKFFTKGTGEVPLVAVFTKFDAEIIKEYVKLNDMEDDEDKWCKAKENAEDTFQRVYLPKVMNTEYPPRTYVQLEDMDLPETDCTELTEKSASTIDDPILNRLFVSTQMNNLDLCVTTAFQHVLNRDGINMRDALWLVTNSFPHYW